MLSGRLQSYPSNSLTAEIDPPSCDHGSVIRVGPRGSFCCKHQGSLQALMDADGAPCKSGSTKNEQEALSAMMLVHIKLRNVISFLQIVVITRQYTQTRTPVQVCF